MIKVKFTDNFDKYDAYEPTMDILRKHFGEVIVSEEPDFLFCSVGKGEYLNYNCARIFWTGENIVPDFNMYDYAIGFHYIDFEDRYMRMPLYFFYQDDYKKALIKHKVHGETKDKKFCNFVYSNGGTADPTREKFFDELSKYKQVDSGGRFRNNVGGPVENKYDFQKDYKFSIAFENASVKGYTTEKIIQAFAAGTVPIYFGNPRISEEFNKNAFINYHDFSSMKEVIDKIIEIDNDDKLYDQYINEPIYLEGNKDPFIEYEKFIVDICSQNPDKAIRRCNVCWGEMLQDKKKKYYRINNFIDKRTLVSRVINKIIK